MLLSPSVEEKHFTPEEIDRGIALLRKRLDEVLQVGSLQCDDPRVCNVESNIRGTIRQVFGPRSQEFQEDEYFEFARIFSTEDSSEERQENFLKGVRAAESKLLALIARLEEKREVFALDPAAHFRATLEGFELHPRIAEVSVQLYRDQHCREAAFAAAKALVLLVKDRAGNPKNKNGKELDGTDLMYQVFSVNNPRLAFNDLKDDSDRVEQEGMMCLFAGAVLAIRNPRGHKFPYDSPERALEVLVFLSMLAKRLDEAKSTPSTTRAA